MFPLTHAYAIGRLVAVPEPLHILGAIFPDAVLTNGLPWDKAHCSGAEIYAFLAARDLSLLPFAVGAITHGVRPPGLDYYGDEKYDGFEKGYCFEEARPYAARVATICRLPASMGWWKAHNFVEMAIEWLLAEQDPRLGPAVEQALGDQRACARLAPHLGAFFQADGAAVAASLPAMLPFLALRDATPAGLAAKYELQVRRKHGVEAIDVDGAAELIAEIAGVIQPGCWAFMDEAVGKIGATLEQLAPLRAP